MLPLIYLFASWSPGSAGSSVDTRFDNLLSTCHCALLDTLLRFFDVLRPSFRMFLKGTPKRPVRAKAQARRTRPSNRDAASIGYLPSRQIISTGPHLTNRAVAIYISTTVPHPSSIGGQGWLVSSCPYNVSLYVVSPFSSSHLRARNRSRGVYRFQSDSACAPPANMRPLEGGVGQGYGTVEVLGRIYRISSTVNTRYDTKQG